MAESRPQSALPNAHADKLPSPLGSVRLGREAGNARPAEVPAHDE